MAHSPIAPHDRLQQDSQERREMATTRPPRTRGTERTYGRSRKAIAAAVADDTGYTTAAVDEIIASFLGHVAAELAAGERVTLRSFGSFELSHRPAQRTGVRHPGTGKPVHAPEHTRVLFRPSPSLRNILTPGRTP